MSKPCPECGKPMWTPGLRRRFGLWLRVKLERLAFRIDMATAPRFDRTEMGHLHLSDQEWAAFQDVIR